MKEVKFRGKRLDNGEWITGYYGFKEESNKHFIMVETINVHHPSYFTDYEVIPESVGQYTGLNDKHNAFIFNGDILDGSYISPLSQMISKRHYKVVYKNACYYAELIGHHPYGSTFLYFVNKESKVIGNIYEKPELLEVE